MKNIDTILEEFNEKFGVIEPGIIPFSEQFSADYHKDFIRTGFAEYKTGLKEAIEGMKAKLRDKHRNDSWADHELPDVAHNATLDSVLELLK